MSKNPNTDTLISHSLGSSASLEYGKDKPNINNITHGGLKVNGKKVSIPSFQCKPKDIIETKSQSTKDMVKKSMEGIPREVPSHLEFDKDNVKGNVLSIINRDEVGLQINELLIVEFYSRR